MAERQLPKLNVAGSIPVSRSTCTTAGLTLAASTGHTVSDEDDVPVRIALLHVHVHVSRIRAAGVTLQLPQAASPDWPGPLSGSGLVVSPGRASSPGPSSPCIHSMHPRSRS